MVLQQTGGTYRLSTLANAPGTLGFDREASVVSVSPRV